MVFSGINYLAVLAAVAGSMGVGMIWYKVFSAPWQRAVGLDENGAKPEARKMIITLAAQVILAWVLAGLIGHMGAVTLKNAVITALFAWFGFVFSPMMVNYTFQNRPASLTLIDAGHWLVVFAVMGAIIGVFGIQ